jgi:hypothetical protein
MLCAAFIFAVLAAAFCVHAQNANDGQPPTSTNAPSVTPAESEPTGSGEEKTAEQDDELTKLAKQTQNPVANLISVPFENNFNFGVGPNDVVAYDLDIEPIIPISLSEDWNLITRTIIPILSVNSPAPGVPSTAGLGDINPTFFLSPAGSKKLLWGVGPTFTFPTATDPVLGAGKWCAGPAVVVLTMQGHWVIGALANNQWSFAGWGNRDVNAMLMEPFVNYNFGHGWYVVTDDIITANWEVSDPNRWTVPLGGGMGKIVRVGKLPLNVKAEAYGNVVRPTGGPSWQFRFEITFLFPK